MNTYPCFGLEFLGQCVYNPTNPTVYFSIGQLIPLIIIAITVYSMMNPIIKLRIRANRLFQYKPNFFSFKSWINKFQCPDPFQPLALGVKYFISSITLNLFYYLAILSILSVFFSAIIPSIPDFYKIPVIGYPVFWELLSGLILASLGIVLIKIISKPAILTPHNFKEFFNCTVDIIDRREEKELLFLAKELTPSLKYIINIGRHYESRYQKIQILVLKKYSKNNSSLSIREINQFIKKDKELQKKLYLYEIHDFCFKIMDLLSDKLFCKVVACKAPGFAEEFLTYFSINNLSHPGERKIFGNIMKSSFENEDSILNRENKYDGLGGMTNLTRLIFENERLLQQSPFNSLISWIESVYFTKEWQIKLYFSCLKVALKTSFNISCHQTLGHIHNGFLSIMDRVGYDHLPFKQEVNLLGQIEMEISNILHFINDNTDKIKKYSVRYSLVFPIGFHADIKSCHQISLYDIMAKSIFDFLLKLSSVEVKILDDQFVVRSQGIGLLQHLLSSNNTKKGTKEISKILLIYIKYHINEHNFKSRWYPPLTKYMIICFGLQYPANPKNITDEWQAFTIYLLNKLKADFHTLYISEKKFALSLLPLGVSYNPEKKIITQKTHWRFERERILQCE